MESHRAGKVQGLCDSVLPTKDDREFLRGVFKLRADWIETRKTDHLVASPRSDGASGSHRARGRRESGPDTPSRRSRRALELEPKHKSSMSTAPAMARLGAPRCCPAGKDAPIPRWRANIASMKLSEVESFQVTLARPYRLCRPCRNGGDACVRLLEPRARV